MHTNSHESSLASPSLTKDGELFHGTKADIVDCSARKEHKYTKHPTTSCAIIDGAMLVRKLKPFSSSTVGVGEYIDNGLMSNIMAKFTYADRIDLVFDTYRPDSIKNATREGRGSGSGSGKRRKIEANLILPSSWSEFLSVSETKTEFFSFIAKLLLERMDIPDGESNSLSL